MLRLFLFILLSISLAATAQIYKSVDENGNTVYSDTPPANNGKAETLKIGTTNSSSPPPDIPIPVPVVKEKKIEVSVEIISPPMDTTIAIGYSGNFSVEAAVKPVLAAGSTAQLFMDGTALGAPQAGTFWALNNTFRGTHILTVVITDTTGKTLASSPPITVHVIRAAIGR